MLESVIDGIRIAGIQCAVPAKIRHTDEWKLQFGDKAVDDFKKMVGVEQVHVAEEEQTASDLAFVAANNLLNEAGISKEDVGILIFVTQYPDYRIPATACVLANRLSLSKDCMAFDINLGCSGYVYGLNLAAQLLKGVSASYALLLVGDTSNKGISKQDKSACMLFGDAGAVTLLTKDENASQITGTFATDGSGFKAIIEPSGAYRNRFASEEAVLWPVDGNIRSDYDLYMNGTDVFSFTISEVPRQIKKFMKQLELEFCDYDLFAMHQANKFILEQVAKKAKIPVDKMPISMDRYGNTSVTSIPLTLCDSSFNNQKDLHVLMCGFGVGLSWGCIDAVLPAGIIRGVVETNDYYTEGSVSHD